MSICGIACVRNSHELLAMSMEHLALNGIDDFFIYDHASDPALRPHLSEAYRSRGIRVRILRKNSRPFFHQAMVNALADLARADGFEIAVAFDADEFWCSTVEGRTLAEQVALEMSTGEDGVRVPVVNYVQHQEVHELGVDFLSTCRYSVVPHLDPATPPALQVNAGMPFVAMPFPSKVVVRLSHGVRLEEGQHGLVKDSGDCRIVEAAGIVVRHLSLPCSNDLIDKRAHGLARIAAGYSAEVGWQTQRLAHMTDRELEDYWRGNSWRRADDGSARVGDYDRLVEDHALVRIGREVARARGEVANADGDPVDGRSPLAEVTPQALEHLVESLVDEVGRTERTMETHIDAVEKELGGRLMALQREFDERTAWALQLDRQLRRKARALATPRSALRRLAMALGSLPWSRVPMAASEVLRRVRGHDRGAGR